MYQCNTCATAYQSCHCLKNADTSKARWITTPRQSSLLIINITAVA